MKPLYISEQPRIPITYLHEYRMPRKKNKNNTTHSELINSLKQSIKQLGCMTDIVNLHNYLCAIESEVGGKLINVLIPIIAFEFASWRIGLIQVSPQLSPPISSMVVRTQNSEAKVDQA